MKPTLIFVYNADSGLFNTLTDIAHKIFSPQTYACNLCGLTYSHFGMKQEWKDFLGSLDLRLEFLHRDEFQARYEMEGVSLPAVFKKVGNDLQLLLEAEAIDSCKHSDDLKQLVTKKLSCG
ncbi:hypothetical protein EDS67_29015 [candidate division KSB1 bacterium]|nr:MAG: hypothetical protein EDS67_29015 [candidate division KSB1 bacterium]MBC6949635.1 hypothetical protein [candidate division KSB1 bacterium]MCE7945498.1 hypothetical protein [Chlorobi bacterium CHB1]MDL1879373.1 hypothetical protein [Cytophagia bacterium CHB2]